MMFKINSVVLHKVIVPFLLDCPSWPPSYGSSHLPTQYPLSPPSLQWLLCLYFLFQLNGIQIFKSETCVSIKIPSFCSSFHIQPIPKFHQIYLADVLKRVHFLDPAAIILILATIICCLDDSTSLQVRFFPYLLPSNPSPHCSQNKLWNFQSWCSLFCWNFSHDPLEEA